MNLVHNERTKLTASWLNALSAASVAAGVIAPFATRFYGVSSADVHLLYIGAAIWFFGGAALHLTARWLLRNLKND